MAAALTPARRRAASASHRCASAWRRWAAGCAWRATLALGRRSPRAVREHMPDPITILLIDDHRVVRQGVRAFLSTQPDLLVVGEAESGAEGVRLAAQFVPDIALMDLVMPGMD